MSSTFAWVDFAEDDRRKMADVMPWLTWIDPSSPRPEEATLNLNLLPSRPC
jgi:hypothetical protein